MTLTCDQKWIFTNNTKPKPAKQLNRIRFFSAVENFHNFYFSIQKLCENQNENLINLLANVVKLMCMILSGDVSQAKREKTCRSVKIQHKAKAPFR